MKIHHDPKEKNYLDYVRKAYGPDKAIEMMGRPDISVKDLNKLRKLEGGVNPFRFTITKKDKKKFKVDKEFDEDLK